MAPPETKTKFKLLSGNINIRRDSKLYQIVSYSLNVQHVSSLLSIPRYRIDNERSIIKYYLQKVLKMLSLKH